MTSKDIIEFHGNKVSSEGDNLRISGQKQKVGIYREGEEKVYCEIIEGKKEDSGLKNLGGGKPPQKIHIGSSGYFSSKRKGKYAYELEKEGLGGYKLMIRKSTNPLFVLDQRGKVMQKRKNGRTKVNPPIKGVKLIKIPKNNDELYISIKQEVVKSKSRTISR